jgi:hypothetical protein
MARDHGLRRHIKTLRKRRAHDIYKFDILALKRADHMTCNYYDYDYDDPQLNKQNTQSILKMQEEMQELTKSEPFTNLADESSL